MNYSPQEIIAITIRRYLKPPDDELFWRDYRKLKPASPDELFRIIEKYFTVEQIKNNPLIPGDLILYDYLKNINGDSSFPLDELIKHYAKEFFTPDDNDFYNRVIYEQEIIKLKEEVESLKVKAEEAIEAKRNFVSRDYIIIRSLGSGGFGTVLLVKHRLSEQLFAAKRLTDIGKSDQITIHKEIKTLASFSHPNIIGYRNGFNIDSTLFLIMDYCPKGTLNDRLTKQGKLNEDELITLFLALTKTFEFLHQKAIIHHDIKPSNILIGEDDTAKVSDFGCVNSRIGTLTYMPPEYFESNEYQVNPKTDIYSLGVTLMECALGYNPLNSKNKDERIQMIKTANLPISQLPLWLQETILKATHYEGTSRFQTMKEFHDSLVNRNIPTFLDSKLIYLEKEALRLGNLVQNKKWVKARVFVNSHPYLLKNLNLAINAGNYFLKTHDLKNAKHCFESALKLNPQANIEKQLAEVYLQSGETAKASSILTGYINRNFNDLEAHNQLLYSYFLSDRWELGKEQAMLIKDIFPKGMIIRNNLALFGILLKGNRDEIYEDIKNEPFGKYNFEVLNNNLPISWDYKKAPTLKSKLLFQEYKFHRISNSLNKIEITIKDNLHTLSDPIISFGREGYDYNTFSQFNGNISRRHFVIVNMKNNVWLYDLGSYSGVFVDGKKVDRKCFLLGLHKIKFGGCEILVKTDSRMLI